MVMLKGSTRPSYAVLGRLQGTDVFRNVQRYPTAEEEHGVRNFHFRPGLPSRPTPLSHHTDGRGATQVFVFRFDAELNFTNKGFFKATLFRLVKERQQRGQFIRVVVLDLYGVHDIDATAIKMFKSVVSELSSGKGGAAAGGGAMEVVMAGAKGPVRDMLRRGGLIKTVRVRNPHRQLQTASLGLRGCGTCLVTYYGGAERASRTEPTLELAFGAACEPKGVAGGHGRGGPSGQVDLVRVMQPTAQVWRWAVH
jgi:MFS superfamily sulfate permease-like transporter